MASASPPDEFEHQDELFSSPFSIVREALEHHAFPAASVTVTHHGKLVARKSFGTFVYEGGLEGGPLLRDVGKSGGFDFRDSEVNHGTLFDLASLTKVVATTTMAMILNERGLLELDAPIIGTVPEFLVDACAEVDPRRQAVTLRMLLAHSSGLPAYEKLFLKAKTRDELLR